MYTLAASECTHSPYATSLSCSHARIKDILLITTVTINLQSTHIKDKTAIHDMCGNLQVFW